MPAILLKFLAPLAPYLAIAIVILGATLYIAHLRHNLAAATLNNAVQAKQISQLVQTNQENAAAIAAYKLQQARWNAALDALDAQTLSTNTAADSIIGDITVSPASADGPVAPVLAQTLASISKLQGTTP